MVIGGYIIRVTRSNGFRSRESCQSKVLLHDILSEVNRWNGPVGSDDIKCTAQEAFMATLLRPGDTCG